MRFALIYHGCNIPSDRVNENCEQLWTWIRQLRDSGVQTATLVANGGNTVSQNSVDDYAGSVFGVSIIEADSMPAMVELTRTGPSCGMVAGSTFFSNCMTNAGEQEGGKT